NLVVVPASAVATSSSGDVTASVTVDLQSASIPTGITLTYAWQITRTDGSTARSAIAPVEWADNRYDWTLLTGGVIRLHYFQLDTAFAQQILASAQSTVALLEKPYGVPHSRTIDIWVYPDSTSFRGSLPANTRDTVAGGSFVGFSLIVAVIPNGSTSEVRRVIPHEVSHQMLYQATRNPFTILPVWFDEGMATHIQVGGTATYLGMVINSYRNDALFDLTSLAAAFPYDASQATLAYAASWSAVLYIEETYGTSGIERMIAAFKSGDPADGVIRSALGISMDQFNRNWKAWIGTLPSTS
ncbi:MAG TPA: peptidase MA family metallohydrolase, partial [Thermomicrobiales bacterium]|nr:peptidase MA family metallohydrolase [Thermomicrobiales bacterium]